MDNFNEQLNEKRSQLDSNPNDFDANFGIGDVYYQEGEKSYNQANSFSDQQDKTTMLNTGQKMMEDSMPYFEKAYQLKQEKIVHSRLESVYTRLGMHDKIKGINERIKD